MFDIMNDIEYCQVSLGVGVCQDWDKSCFHQRTCSSVCFIGA